MGDKTSIDAIKSPYPPVEKLSLICIRYLEKRTNIFPNGDLIGGESYPISSNGISTYIGLKFMVNVGKYTARPMDASWVW